jgi:hypothetical protein
MRFEPLLGQRSALLDAIYSTADRVLARIHGNSVRFESPATSWYEEHLYREARLAGSLALDYLGREGA